MPAKPFLLNYRNWSEKGRQRMQSFFKTIFFSKGSPGEVESSFKTSLKLFRQSAETFPLDIQKRNEFKFLHKKFSPKSSFDNHAHIFLTKHQETFSQNPKKIRRINLLNKLSQKTSFGPANFIFDNPVDVFLKRSWKIVVCCPKKIEKCTFWKSLFL